MPMQLPFGMTVPGTDGMPYPPNGYAAPPPGADPEPSQGFSPPPAMPPPPVDSMQSRPMQPPMPNLPTTPGGNLATPPGDSDKKGNGLSKWLPLILGTVGGGILAAKNQSLTDFGTNLLQGAAAQAFNISEEKRKRQFDLDTANLKQGQEAIKDLIAINDNDLVALQKEVENNPQFAHMAAYIQPLREAKQKYSDFASPSSDGGTKITAKEAAELAHYYNAIKGAKEAINKFHGSQQQLGFDELKIDATNRAKFQEAKAALQEMFPNATEDELKAFWIKNGGRSGEFTSTVRAKMEQAAALAVQQGKATSVQEVLSNPMRRAQALNDWEVYMAGAKSGASSAATFGDRKNLKEVPTSRWVVGADGTPVALGGPGGGSGPSPNGAPGGPQPIPQPFPTDQKTRAEANINLLKGVGRIKQLAASPQVQKELGSAFGANWANLSWSKLQGRAADLSPETQEFINEVGFLTSDKIKEKYGTAFTTNEAGMAGSWISKPTDSLSKIMTSMKSFENHAYKTLESIRDTNPTQKNAQMFKDYLEPREMKLQQKYQAFVKAAKEKFPNKAVPAFAQWRLLVGE